MFWLIITTPWKQDHSIFLMTLLRHKCFVSQTQVNPPRQCLPWSKQVAGRPNPMESDIPAAKAAKTARQVLQRLVMISWSLLSSPNHTPSSFPGLVCVSNAYVWRWGATRGTAGWSSLGGRLSRLLGSGPSVPSGGSSRQLRGLEEWAWVILQGDVLELRL